MKRILILDDEKDACMLMERILRPSYEVVSFTEAKDALDYARAHEVDLAVLDLKLKETTGIQVLEELRKDRPDLKALILTGYPTVQTAHEAITLGAFDYLTKPLDIDQLEAKIKEVLAGGSQGPRSPSSSGTAEDASPSE